MCWHFKLGEFKCKNRSFVLLLGKWVIGSQMGFVAAAALCSGHIVSFSLPLLLLLSNYSHFVVISIECHCRLRKVCVCGARIKARRFQWLLLLLL